METKNQTWHFATDTPYADQTFTSSYEKALINQPPPTSFRRDSDYVYLRSKSKTPTQNLGNYNLNSGVTSADNITWHFRLSDFIENPELIEIHFGNFTLTNPTPYIYISIKELDFLNTDEISQQCFSIVPLVSSSSTGCYNIDLKCTQHTIRKIEKSSNIKRLANLTLRIFDSDCNPISFDNVNDFFFVGIKFIKRLNEIKNE